MPLSLFFLKRNTIIRYKLISCGVLKKEFDSLRKTLPDTVELTEVWLEQGLHREPDRLNELIKEEIERTEVGNEQFDALLLGYGICSQGTVGVSSSRYKIVVPRAHDCITLFLGSKERYLEEFSQSPGTYWFTPGFIHRKMQPGMSEKYAGIYHQFEENYENYLEKFGDESSAKFVIDHQEQAWIKNYSRGAFVNGGLPGGNALRKKAQAFCRSRNWNFEEITGDFNLIHDLVSGNWDPERFLVIEPGQTLAIGGIDDIITVHDSEQETAGFGDSYEKAYIHDGTYREIVPDDSKTECSPASLKDKMDRIIGIDAGGTYTDAVIISLEENTVLAAAKAPTTYYDLSVGIREAVLKLPAELLKSSERLVISTTLATNAIVEEKGGRTGVLLIGYDEDVASRVTIGARDLKAVVPGLHNIYGEETIRLDERILLDIARTMIDKGVASFAVSSYMGTRNPDHEIRAVSLLSESFSIPVVSGHELTDDIDSVRRATTVLLNARLLPVIDMLVDSINRVAKELGLPDDIRFVTTEGTLMNAAEAKKIPVRMVLSGPAASVAGVRFLTDVDSCVLIDMGGTTTDIAIIDDGSARRTGRGAVVGQYKTSIQATDIRTIGLGGDSRIAWENDSLKVGPKRIIPISILAAEYGTVGKKLETLHGYSKSDYGLVQPGTFYVVRKLPENDSFLSSRERHILKLLDDGPLSEVELAERLDYPYYSLLGIGHLEELGIVLASGLTPTDIFAYSAVSGDFFDQIGLQPSVSAATCMLELYAERTGLHIDDIIEYTRSEIHRLVSLEIIGEGLSDNGNGSPLMYMNRSDLRSFPQKRNYGAFEKSSAVEVLYKLNYPLVGIGAPSELMLDGVERYLSADKLFPQRGEVANAVGAASGAGGMHIDMSIMPDEQGRFLLYSPDGKFIFRSLADAKTEALKLSREHALTYAALMGYGYFRLDVKVKDRSAPTAFSGEIYIDTVVSAKMIF
ncbi:DUF1638 domain-containing protein [Candidatus Omnitrophota bacterium]